MHPVLSSDIQYAYRKNISALFQWIKWKQVVLFKLHKGMTEKKIVTKKKNPPCLCKCTKQQNTFLPGSAWLYLFAIWNYYADKYNPVGIRHHLEINIFETYIYHKKNPHYQIQWNRWILIRDQERLNAASTEDWYLLTKKQSGHSEQQVATDIWHIYWSIKGVPQFHLHIYRTM